MTSRNYDDSQRRNQWQESGSDRYGRHNEYPGTGYREGSRQQGSNQERGYGEQSYQGGGYGSSRLEGPDDLRYGGFGQPQPSQYNRPEWGGQQQGFDHDNGSRQAGHGYGYGGDRFSDEYSNRQFGQRSGQQGGNDRYGQGFYGDASRFAQGDGWSQNTNQGSTLDPDYQQWRDEQLRSLDADYESWRGERYKKFSDEFNTWRTNRPQDNNKTQQGRASGSSGGKAKDQS